jgi:hypothetical protein
MNSINKLVPIAVSFFLSLPVYLFCYAVILSELTKDSTVGIASLLIIGLAWFLFAFLLLERTFNIRKSVSLGFLFWASEWFITALILIVVLIFNDLYMQFFSSPTDSKELSKAISKGVATISIGLGIIVCFFMSLFSMLGYSISIFLSRELSSEV